MASELTVDGYDAALKRLAEFEDNLRNKVSKSALKAGAKEIQKAISEEVHVSSVHEQHIRDDIQIFSPKQTDTGWKITIGPGKATAWRAKFLEFGHMKKGGGRVPPFPFMEPGLAKSKSEFMRTVAAVIRKEL